ncbi:MAG: urea ABC transporter permease subunit UrtB [Actinobacteria bacterium]|nr:urea ABC transporter permease subunit UrtB [Actinomycetota bacterium]
MEALLEQIFNGVSLGSILLIVALGLSFSFGQMGVINMAHGELIMIGAYTPYFLQSESGWFDGGAAGTAFVVALPLGFLAAGLVGVAMERTLLRRMVGRPLDTLLVTFGVSLILQQAARDTFGAPNVDVVSPTWLTGRWELLGVVMPHRRLFIIALVMLAVAALSAFLATRPEGRRMRAVMQNRDLAEVSGLSTRRVDRTTFFLGSALAGLAGVAVSLVGSVGSQVGTGYIVDAFLVVIVGGLGKLRGAIVGALALGLLNAFSEFWTSASIGKAVVFVAVIAFLQFRPNGLVSFRTRGLVA